MKSGGQQASGSGLAPNVASLLCYICAPLTSIIFLLIEKENKDVKFHAWQGTFYGATLIGLNIVLNIVGFLLGRMADFLGALILSFLLPVVWIGLFILWIVLLIKAYQGERWKLPILGDIAAQKAGV